MASWFRGRRQGHKHLLDIDDASVAECVDEVKENLGLLLNHNPTLRDYFNYFSQCGSNPDSVYITNLTTELTDLKNNVEASLKALKSCQKASGQTGHGLDHNDDDDSYRGQRGQGYGDWYD